MKGADLLLVALPLGLIAGLTLGAKAAAGRSGQSSAPIRAAGLAAAAWLGLTAALVRSGFLAE